MLSGTGTITLSLVHSEDTYGYSALVRWSDGVVTHERLGSGTAGHERVEGRDELTVDALLGLIVPNIDPVPDFEVFWYGWDHGDLREKGLTLTVAGGRATIKRASANEARPAHLPAWFLVTLHELLFGENAHEGNDDVEDAA